MTTETTRHAAIEQFLSQAGWQSANRAAISGDASSRSYTRLHLNEKTAILMNTPPAEETASCPPNATPDERFALGYNAIARLAGPNLHAFISISKTLREAGLSAPEIFNADTDEGLAIIEDLGDNLFVNAVTSQTDEITLYQNAIDALIQLRDMSPSPPMTADFQMLHYDETAMLAEVSLLTDWYWPHARGSRPSAAIVSEYQKIWKTLLSSLTPPRAIVLRDFHAENLLWIPSRQGVARVGIIDFQDGLIGHYGYDLVSLLEDARRDVTPALASKMLDYYCKKAKLFADFDESRLRGEFAILGAQRNAKILGIFARLINRDKKDRYQEFIPRVQSYFRNNLDHPDLRHLKSFFAMHFVELIT